MSQPMKIRADYFADPEALARYYDNIEREILSPNSFFNYLRALLLPTRND
jgi:hypothetical protein